MNMKAEAIKIYQQPITNTEKIKRLNDLILDCHNELVAQNENMHPEVIHGNEEGIRIAKDYIRVLESAN